MRDPAVLITGASSGIGEALAREYARRGARLTLLARRKDRLERLASELRVPCVAVQCDVSRDGELESAFEAATRAHGRIDVVVANAGFGVMGAVERLDLDDFRRQFETNVFGVLRTVKASIDPLRRTRGRLAVVGSVNGYVATPGTAPYAMSKFAVRALCETLDSELAAEGVSVTHVAPGFVATEIRLRGNDGRLRGGEDPIPGFLTLSAGAAARQIADAVTARRPEVVITTTGKLAAFVQRHAPFVLRGAFRVASRRVLSQLEELG